MAHAAPPVQPPDVSLGGGSAPESAGHLLRGQAHVLERIARGAPLPEVLEAIVTLIESAAPGMLCSILLLDREGRRLRHGAAPRLPAAYNTAVDGLEIGPNAGSCGTAAFRRQAVIVRDVQVDPLWERYRALAAPHDLRACWSTPILSAAGRVLGTFAMYYHEPREPTAAEQELITTATDLAGIAIERRHSEEALRESEQRFSKAFHANPAPLSITRLEDGLFLDVNAAFLRLTGLPRDEVIGRTSVHLGLIGEAERGSLLERLHGTGAIPEIEFVVRHRDGRPRDVVVSLVSCDLGGDACILSIFQDVTQRRQADDALRTRERQLLLAQQIAHMGSWEWDMHTGALSWSDELWRMLGLEPGAVRPSYEAFLALVHPEDRGAVREIIDRAAGDGQPFRFDFRTCRPDGSVRILHCRGEVTCDAAGRPVRMFGTDQDVTELRLADEQLRLSQQKLRNLTAHQLEVREEERGRIAREIHDVVGQTLTALKLDVSSLREMVAHREPGADDRLQEIAGLLDTAIKDVRRLASELRPVVLDQLGLPAAIEWLSRDFERRTGIECRVRAQLPDLTLPEEVSTGLFRILQEALTNVARHSGASCVDVTLDHAGRIVTLSVTDNGNGLSEAAQASQDSLGILGMRERALLLGGFIDLKGERGKGTTVSAWVPLK